MNPVERRATVALASIYALRMLGLFMLLPVLAIYAETLPGSTPLLIGLAVGVYGLTQACLQIPFGLLSDRIGRKPVISAGLLLFALGSVVAALSTGIAGLLIGRALQGAGAVAAAIMALLADLTREEKRTQAMAIIGMTIGASYMVAMVAGPALAGVMGVPRLFLLIAVLALLVQIVLWRLVPNPLMVRHHRDTEFTPGNIAPTLTDPRLWRLDLSIFLLHLVMTANFVVLPGVLTGEAGLPVAHHWYVYLPVMILAVIAMVPLVIVAEKYRKLKPVFLAAIALQLFAEGLLYEGGDHFPVLVAGLWLYFVGFNVLEALLPSLVSRSAPVTQKGTALGVYSTAQFLGAFAGGALAGYASGLWGAQGVFMAAGVILAVWLIPALTLQPPAHLLTRSYNLGNITADRAAEIGGRLGQLAGVAEVQMISEEQLIWLRVDSREYDEARTMELLAELRGA